MLSKGNEGQKGQVIFQAANRRAGATIFWRLDENYLGRTKDIHQMTATPSPGNHKLLIIDELENSSTRYFKVVE